MALAVYERLNKDYNLDDLVPIYRMRREIGDRVSRSHFSEWLLEMQEKDILQLQGSSLEDSTPDKNRRFHQYRTGWTTLLCQTSEIIN